MLDHRLLRKFIFRFYGYGNPRAPYWFVGMEEGIKKSENTEKMANKIAKKLNLWDELGCCHLSLYTEPGVVTHVEPPVFSHAEPAVVTHTEPARCQPN